MIGTERKERLLGHLKEAAEFAETMLAPVGLSDLTKIDYKISNNCCPLNIFLHDSLVCFANGEVCDKSYPIRATSIYNYNDTNWWRSLTPNTRKSVIKWLNERIGKGFL